MSAQRLLIYKLKNETGFVFFIFLALFTRCSNCEETSVSWVISENICENSATCSCPSDTNENLFIKCKCSPNNGQGIILKGDGHARQKTLYLLIEDCHNISISSNAFYNFKGPEIEIVFKNIRNMDLVKNSFALSAKRRDLLFENVNFKDLPGESFSSFYSATFSNSQIEKISTFAFKPPNLKLLTFNNTQIKTIESQSFEENILIDQINFINTTIKNAHKNAFKSSISNLFVIDSELTNIEQGLFNGNAVVNASFIRNFFKNVSSGGLAPNDWTNFSLINNTFFSIESQGVDFSKNSPIYKAEIVGNSWNTISEDFIKVPLDSHNSLIVQGNKVESECSCRSEFIPQITSKESSNLFVEQFRNSSTCATTPKAFSCLNLTNTRAHNFITYSEWSYLCQELTLCLLSEITSEIPILSTEEVTYGPPISGKLRVLIIFIGTAGVGIVVALLIVLCVFLCRNKREKSSPDEIQMTKSLKRNNENLFKNEDSNWLTNSHTYTTTPPLYRPHSIIFDDVETEEKGVQTLPSDLSAEVLQGLKMKLNDPVLFKETKEKIDHLYDLIHVSSPPDVTMLSGPKTLNSFTQAKRPDRNTTQPRFAQIRNKPQSLKLRSEIDGINFKLGSEVSHDNAKIRSGVSSENLNPRSEYNHPNSNLRSEVSSEFLNKRSIFSQTTNDNRGDSMLCDYTDPKDVQNHVYAELNSTFAPTNSNSRPVSAFYDERRPEHNSRVYLQDQEIFGNKSLYHNNSNSPMSFRRPLPSIPPPSSNLTLR